MEFKEIANDKDGYQVHANDKYKCVRYPLSKRKNKWRAYFKPTGWVNFGNACEHTGRAITAYVNESAAYKTLRKAQQACVRHKAMFGKCPRASDSLRNAL